MTKPSDDGTRPFLCHLRPEDRRRLDFLSGVAGESRSFVIRTLLAQAARELGRRRGEDGD